MNVDRLFRCFLLNSVGMWGFHVCTEQPRNSEKNGFKYPGSSKWQTLHLAAQARDDIGDVVFAFVWHDSQLRVPSPGGILASCP